MAARAKPSGSVPEKTDVKASGASSIPEQEPTEQVEAKSATEETKALADADLDEKDLEAIEGSKIPYSRFKEVNEKAKSSEARLKDLERRYQEDLRRAVEDAETRISQRMSKQQEESSIMDEIDPTQRHVRTLEQQLAAVQNELSSLRGESLQTQLQNRLERLEAKYPEADSLAVLAIAKHLKRTSHEDLEELMQDNHTKNIERAQKQVRQIIEQKKQRAKAAMPTKEGGIRLKESDRPKTLKEAREKLKSYFGS